ncbi:MAG: hypothetical protein IJ706_01725 [Clostridia bacterium]|nr:hypothetical protein [Clostridia bacterium]MBR1676012.1 hypothetical protein [Clostridia bacterium]
MTENVEESLIKGEYPLGHLKEKETADELSSFKVSDLTKKIRSAKLCIKI